MSSDKPQYIDVPTWVLEVMREIIDPWARELKRARKQLSPFRTADRDG